MFILYIVLVALYLLGIAVIFIVCDTVEFHWVLSAILSIIWPLFIIVLIILTIVSFVMLTIQRVISYVKEKRVK